MGYSTSFKGVLRFENELKASELAILNRYLHYESDFDTKDGRQQFGYVDLEITDDFEGLQWTGAEKTCYMEEQIKYIIDNMHKEVLSFKLKGSFIAQGEDLDDMYEIIVDGQTVTTIPILPTGSKITCPNCEHQFYNEK